MEVSTNELTFEGTFKTPTTTTIMLKNPTATPLGFKIKTNASKVYSVKPNVGTIGANDTATINITLPMLKQALPKNYKSAHKFLVVSLPSDGADVELNWKDLETKYLNVMTSHKIKVNYIDKNVTTETSKLNGKSQRISKFAPNGTVKAAGTGVGSHGGSHASHNAAHNGAVAREIGDAGATASAAAAGVAVGASADTKSSSAGAGGSHRHHRNNHPYSHTPENDQQPRSSPQVVYSAPEPQVVVQDVTKELDSLSAQVDRLGKKMDNVEKLMILALMLLSFILGRSIV